MQSNTQPSKLEFVALMASLMSIVALSIDAILPALDQIGISIGTNHSSENQMLITMIFLGLGVGQLIFGPISDSLGRKPVVYVGFLIFVAASILCVYAESLEIMVLGRILQGIGLSAPRTLAIAMIRDTYSGDYMAKIMSFVVAIFILVPIVAPTLGKLFLDSFGWESIFYSQLVFGVIVLIWLWRRQPETLKPEYKKAFTLSLFVEGSKEFVKHRAAIVFTLISGLITGAFMVFLSTSQHIFQEQYQLKEEFPYIFGGLAFSVGLATFFNGTLVMRFGMRKLVDIFSVLFALVSLLYVVLFYGVGNPSIYVLVLFFTVQFFCIGFLFGNLRSLAMQPLGHIAGIGAAINGFVSTVMAVPIATFIGSFVLTTSLPLFVGFLIAGICSIVLLLFVKRA
ncbi:multidrug effflux MFS transporter [Flavobacteriaceae bacterium S356]|uniref:Multidrug effflux MFS transporter n=1 Tax=Asprobacillus argus TaxID=3076534 RepID=A0ABU3LEU4_9FLAO|nr:multidrug effflux MFS transporter [Flavobacteriaceae bacterium S356]